MIQKIKPFNIDVVDGMTEREIIVGNKKFIFHYKNRIEEIKGRCGTLASESSVYRMK